MIRINLIKSQVPSRIDLPKQKKDYKFILKVVTTSMFFLILASLVIYFLFISGSKKIHVQIQKQYVIKTTAINKNIKETAKRNNNNLNETIHKTNTYKIKKPKTHEKNKHITVEIKHKNRTQKQSKKPTTSIKHKILKQKESAKKIILKLKKTELPIFSLNIKLSKIPRPIKHKFVSDILYQQLIKDNETVKNTAKTNAQTKSISTNKNIMHIKIRTKRITLLKKYLKKMNIHYKIKRIIYKTVTTYEILVGGFDSYPKIAKFALDLKSKGYKVYKISNINLLFYVCIDKHANETIKNRYVTVWSKTPFKILSVKHTKKYYATLFEFKCSKKQFNILKNKGYYPIISKSEKNGA